MYSSQDISFRFTSVAAYPTGHGPLRGTGRDGETNGPPATAGNAAPQEAKAAGKPGAAAGADKGKGGDGNLGQEEQQQVEKLKQRDREVRAHEAAHMAAAGGLAMGGASFSYQRGPDGVMYAVGGEVNIDTSPVPDDPAATLQKAQQVQAAAMAPADPSSQDRQVAAQAAQMAAEARAQMATQRMEGGGGEEGGTGARRAQAAAAYGGASGAAGALRGAVDVFA